MTVWLDLLLRDAGAVELRQRTAVGWRSDWFTDAHALRTAVQRLSGDSEAYCTLNTPQGRKPLTRPLRDADVGVVVRLPFDFDPIRPKGTPSSDQELAGAVAVRDELVALLACHGWPAPALATSGNGAHAVYRCRLACDGVWREVAARLYLGLRNRLAESCERHGVAFDTSVRNPGRVWRIYARRNRKGAETPGRPHRMAEIHIPLSGWQPVPAVAINRVVGALKPVVAERPRPESRVPITGHGDYRTLDVHAWFDAHGAYLRPLGGGKHAVRCPWAHEHSTPPREQDTSTVVFETHGGMWPNFHCSHAHCEGRGIRDVLALWDDGDAFCAQPWRAGHGP